MATAGSSGLSRHEARWLRRSAPGAVAWRETVSARAGSFQAIFRACADGGCVVTFPALPRLMVRGATCQHARVKALALVERYLRSLPAGPARPAPAPAGDRQLALRLAA